MGRVNDTISNVNSAFRNLLLAVLIAGAGLFGYKGYEIYNEPKQKLADKEAELEKTVASLKQAEAQINRLEVARKLLKVRHRLARIKVLDQHEVASLNPVTPSSGTESEASRPNLTTKIEFQEIDDYDKPLGAAKQFDIAGDMVYVDFLRVTFDDKFIEACDLERSTSLALFQRVFGEHQEPAQGFQLDTVGTRPSAYAGSPKMSDFEKTIWDDFWLIANDPKRAADMGIHAANGDAVSMRVQPGKTYEVDLRSTGEIAVRAVEPPAPPAIAPKS